MIASKDEAAELEERVRLADSSVPRNGGDKAICRCNS